MAWYDGIVNGAKWVGKRGMDAVVWTSAWTHPSQHAQVWRDYKETVKKDGYTSFATGVGREVVSDAKVAVTNPSESAMVNSVAELGKDLYRAADNPIDSLVLAGVASQTGIPTAKLEKDVFPLIGEDVTETALTAALITKNNDANLATRALLSNLADSFERNPNRVLNGLQNALLEGGRIPESVEASPVLGPAIQNVRNSIPPEIRGSLSEKQLLEFMHASLTRMASTEEGKTMMASTLRNIDLNTDVGALIQKPNKNGHTFAQMLERASMYEFLSRPDLDKSYHDFQDRVFDKDSVGRLTLKENVSPAIRDMISGIQEQIPPMISKNMDAGAQMGLATSLFQKILDDPKKREALKPYILDPANPENFQAMVQTTKDALTETLTGSSDRALIVDVLKNNFMADPKAQELNRPQEWYEKDAQTIATSLPNILLREDIVRPVMGVVQADQTGKISFNYPQAMKHAKEGILSALEKGETTQDAKNILGVYFRQANPLNLPDDLNERFATSLAQPQTASLIRQVLPEDLSESGVGPRIQENLLTKLRTPEGRNQVASILDSDVRRGITTSLLTSHLGLAPQYASSLSQVLSDDERFKKILGVVGQCDIKDGQLQNAGQLLSEALPNMLNTDADRRALAEAMTPTIRAPLGIKDHSSVSPAAREALGLKDDSISPFAVVSAHFLTSKNLDEFMNRPVTGADGKKYNNLADYLDDKDTKEEIKKLKGNKDAIDFLSRTSEGEWRDICKGLFPDDATFKKFKETLATDPDKAFKTETEGGPFKEDPQKIVRGAYTNVNQLFSGMAYVFGCGTLSRIEEAVEKGETLVEVDKDALARKPENLLGRLAEKPETDEKGEAVQKAEGTQTPTVEDDKPKREGLISALTDMVQTAQAEQPAAAPENTATAEPKNDGTAGMNIRLSREAEKQTPTPEPTKAKGSVITTAASDQKESEKSSENVFAQNAAKNRYSNAA